MLKCVYEIADSRAAWRVEGMFAQLDGSLYPKWKNADTGGDWGAMRVPIVFSWLLNVCRNGALESQILVLFGVLTVCLHDFMNICIQKAEKHGSSRRFGCDTCGNCVYLVAQDVTRWGPEIADSSTGCHGQFIVAHYAKLDRVCGHLGDFSLCRSGLVVLGIGLGVALRIGLVLQSCLQSEAANCDYSDNLKSSTHQVETMCTHRFREFSHMLNDRDRPDHQGIYSQLIISRS